MTEKDFIKSRDERERARMTEQNFIKSRYERAMTDQEYIKSRDERTRMTGIGLIKSRIKKAGITEAGPF